MPWPVGPVKQSELETFGNALSLRAKRVGHIIVEKLAARFIEQGQPAREKLRLYSFHPEMDSDRVALIAPLVSIIDDQKSCMVAR